jgi:hypothetical protein
LSGSIVGRMIKIVGVRHDGTEQEEPERHPCRETRSIAGSTHSQSPERKRGEYVIAPPPSWLERMP